MGLSYSLPCMKVRVLRYLVAHRRGNYLETISKELGIIKEKVHIALTELERECLVDIVWEETTKRNEPPYVETYLINPEKFDDIRKILVFCKK